MHFNIGDILEFTTKYSTLYPGDMILTGTPTGTGPILIGDAIHANMEQDSKMIIEINFNVEEDKNFI